MSLVTYEASNLEGIYSPVSVLKRFLCEVPLKDVYRQPKLLIGKKKRSSSFLPDSWLNLELPFASAKLFCSWLAFWAPPGVLKARWHIQSLHTASHGQIARPNKIWPDRTSRIKILCWFPFFISLFWQPLAAQCWKRTQTLRVWQSVQKVQSHSFPVSLRLFLACHFLKKNTHIC